MNERFALFGRFVQIITVDYHLVPAGNYSCRGGGFPIDFPNDEK